MAESQFADLYNAAYCIFVLKTDPGYLFSSISF